MKIGNAQKRVVEQCNGLFKVLLIQIVVIGYGCADVQKKEKQVVVGVDTDTVMVNTKTTAVFGTQDDCIATRFDFPVGKPDAEGYYNAQPFGENDHLGDDWNGTGGGNSDLGDTIYAIANGRVTYAKDIAGGWGNVIRIQHKDNDGNEYESLYAHCDTVFVKASDKVAIGQKIGTIGTAHGLYYAHLHFEIREHINMPIGGGYSKDKTGYLDPTEFIRTHR